MMIMIIHLSRLIQFQYLFICAPGDFKCKYMLSCLLAIFPLFTFQEWYSIISFHGTWNNILVSNLSRSNGYLRTIWIESRNGLRENSFNSRHAYGIHRIISLLSPSKKFKMRWIHMHGDLEILKRRIDGILSFASHHHPSLLSSLWISLPKSSFLLSVFSFFFLIYFYFSGRHSPNISMYKFTFSSNIFKPLSYL